MMIIAFSIVASTIIVSAFAAVSLLIGATSYDNQ